MEGLAFIRSDDMSSFSAEPWVTYLLPGVSAQKSSSWFLPGGSWLWSVLSTDENFTFRLSGFPKLLVWCWLWCIWKLRVKRPLNNSQTYERSFLNFKYCSHFQSWIQIGLLTQSKKSPNLTSCILAFPWISMKLLQKNVRMKNHDQAEHRQLLWELQDCHW